MVVCYKCAKCWKNFLEIEREKDKDSKESYNSKHVTQKSNQKKKGKFI